MNYRKIPIYINAETGRQIEPSGENVTLVEKFPRLMLAERVILCCQFLTVTGTASPRTTAPAALDEAMTYAVYGNEAKSGTGLMFYAAEQIDAADVDGINDAGDWLDGGTANPAHGQLSARVDTANARFAAALADKNTMTIAAVAEAIPLGENAGRIVLAKISVIAENRPLADAELPEPLPGGDYMTRPETVAALRAAPIYEYSADMLNAHFGLSPGDVWQRIRNSVTGAPCDWQLIPYAPCAITAGTVTTGDPGTAAAATITGDAPNQTLNLTIPRGAKGDPGACILTRAVFAIPVQHAATTGYCHYLDATNPTITLCGNVRSCSALRLYVRSASTVTGNIVLAIACNGTVVKTVTIPVTATDVAQTITFDTAVTGLITITRDTANAADTLADTDKVTAVIGDDIAITEVTA